MSPTQKIRARLRLRLVVALPALLSLFMIISAGLVAFVFPKFLVTRHLDEAGLGQAITFSILLMTGLAFVGNLLAALYISRHLNSFALKIEGAIRREPSLKPDFEATSEIGALGIMLDQASVTLSRFVDDSYIIDNLPEAVIVINFDLSIKRLNTTAGRLLGVSPDVSAGKNLRDFIPETPVSRGFYSLIEEALAGETVHLRAVALSIHGNESRRFWASAHPVRRDRRLMTEVSITIKDQAGMTAIRNQIRKIEQLAAVGSMASTIAHEVRNPLGAIRTFTELIRENLPREDARAGYTEKILEQIQRLDRMVEDTLAFSRDSVTTVKNVDLRELLSRTVALAKYKFSGKPLNVDEDYKPGIPEIRGDPEKLSQAFLNLLINSFEACGEKGWIAVSAGPADDPDENGKTVRVSIADGGSGISPEDKKRLFEPFFTTKADGTGLGLATAHNIFAAHGGLIEVDSEPGRGTTFQVILPEKFHFCDLSGDGSWS